MKQISRKSSLAFKLAISGTAKAARRKAFRNNMPVAVTKNGEVVLIYKDKREEKLLNAIVNL